MRTSPSFAIVMACALVQSAACAPEYPVPVKPECPAGERLVAGVCEFDDLESLVAADAFDRTKKDGWGTAERGGSWTPRLAPPEALSVDEGVGTLVIDDGALPGEAVLNETSVSDVDVVVRVVFDPPPRADVVAYVVVRDQGFARYRLAVFIGPDDGVHVSIVHFGQLETLLGDELLRDRGMEQAGPVWLRARIEGESPTRLAVKAWRGGDDQPEGWDLDVDSAFVTLPAGPIGLGAFVSSEAANGATFVYDDLVARPAADAPE